MMPIATELDHAGYIVRDLDTGASTWQKLGFKLSPISAQMGLNAAGEFEPWATANRCAVFRQGYLELIGVHRPECFNPWLARLEEYEGAHIAAFRVVSANAAFTQLSQHSEDFLAPVARRRDAPFLEAGEWDQREMRFRNIFSKDTCVAEARYIVIEHQTPEILWQPALLDHPNGANGLVALSFCATDVAECLARLDLLGQSRPQPPGAAAIRSCSQGGYVEVLNHTQFGQRFPGAIAPIKNALGSATVSVNDLHTARQHLRENNVPFHDAVDRIWVDANHSCGTVIEFIPLGGTSVA